MAGSTRRRGSGQIAPLIGAQPNEVTSPIQFGEIFKLLTAAARSVAERR
jgi:kynureninase